MLTRCAKAYSSSCSQIASLSFVATFTRAPLFDVPSYAGFLNPENQDLDRRNPRSMLKILYAAFPCLPQLVSVQFALEMCLAAQKLPQMH